MTEGYPRLLGDIGGTHARWAWQPHAGAPLQDSAALPCAASVSLLESAASYLAASRHARPAAAGIGVAAVVAGDRVTMTNGSWSFSIAELERALGLERCLVINDFTALALSLTELQPSDLRPIGGAAPMHGAPMALLGPGTGLGVSGLLPNANGGWSALDGEGGHVTLAATGDHEAEVLSVLRRWFGHVSAERVVSGSGLVNLYEAVCELDGVAAQAPTPADISAAAIAGTDRRCTEAARLFAGFLGNVAGNLALTLGARGGVYLGGGVVPHLGTAFDEGVFRRQFEDKGRFAAYLKPVPVWLITAVAPALIGASRALDLLPD
jgi:glucokinase